MRGSGLREVLIFGAALLAYQATRGVAIGDASTAIANGWDIVRLERAFSLDVEPLVQGWVLSRDSLAAGLNTFYLVAHLPITAAFFVWVYRRHRDRYPLIRNAFLAANAVALVAFVLHPVAPPRLLSGAGFVDTLSTVSNVDLHNGALSGWFNPYAAVPSMHFGYALLVGVGLTVLARGWAVRSVGLIYPGVVLVVIVATANHFVVDAVAGAAVVLAGLGLSALPRLRVWRSLRRAACGHRAAPVSRLDRDVARPTCAVPQRSGCQESASACR